MTAPVSGPTPNLVDRMIPDAPLLGVPAQEILREPSRHTFDKLLKGSEATHIENDDGSSLSKGQLGDAVLALREGEELTLTDANGHRSFIAFEGKDKRGHRIYRLMGGKSVDGRSSIDLIFEGPPGKKTARSGDWLNFENPSYPAKPEGYAFERGSDGDYAFTEAPRSVRKAASAGSRGPVLIEPAQIPGVRSRKTR